MLGLGPSISVPLAVRLAKIAGALVVQDDLMERVEYVLESCVGWFKYTVHDNTSHYRHISCSFTVQIFQNNSVVAYKLESYYTNRVKYVTIHYGSSEHLQMVNGCPFSFLMLVKYTVPEPTLRN
jgi:hypothetical protein